MSDTANSDLHDYFEKEIAEGKTEFRVVAKKTSSGVDFYIHPVDKNGATMDMCLIKYTSYVTLAINQPKDCII